MLRDFTQPTFLKQMAWTITFWLLVMVNIAVNISFLRSHFPDPPRPPDLLLDAIPETAAFVTVGEILSMVLLALVLWVLRERHFVDGPELLFRVGMMFWIRGYVILLTPLAQIQPPADHYAADHLIAQTFYHGMFFSGHTASAFIQAMHFRGHRLQPLMLLLAAGIALSLIASHSHYTIDVVGGWFVAYFVVNFDWMKLIPPRLYGVRWMPWYVPQPVSATAQREMQG